ncbi:TPA: PLP-dependent transferase [Burkholderia cepacia]
MTTHIETKHPFDSLSPATYRASTIVFDKIEDFVTRKSRQPDGYSYGTTGTPTHRQLEARIAKLSSADHCVLAPSGQAALVAAVLTFARAGDHVLLSEAAYGGLKSFASEWMHRLGIVVESYPADASAADIEPLIRPACCYRAAQPKRHKMDLESLFLRALPLLKVAILTTLELGVCAFVLGSIVGLVIALMRLSRYPL